MVEVLPEKETTDAPIETHSEVAHDAIVQFLLHFRPGDWSEQGWILPADLTAREAESDDVANT